MSYTSRTTATPDVPARWYTATNAGFFTYARVSRFGFRWLEVPVDQATHYVDSRTNIAQTLVRGLG